MAIVLLALSLLSAAAASAEGTPGDAESPRQLVVIDQGVEDWRTLERGVTANAEILRLGRGEDGLAAIARAVRTHGALDAIHVLGHGEPGVLRLGRDVVDTASLASHASELRTIRRALKPGADILLAGCRVGAGGKGSRFLRALAVATDADVAASTDASGSTSAGANWRLESAVGSVDRQLALDAGARERFRGTLAISGPAIFGLETYDGDANNRDVFTGTFQADDSADELTFSAWRLDSFDSADIAVNLQEGGPASVITDPAGDSFRFVSFSTEVFCGEPLSFDVVGYEDGSPVAGAQQSYSISSQGGPVTRNAGFASVDEVRFENYVTGNDGQCLSIDDFIVDQAVTSNTQPAFADLDASVTYSEADGVAVVIDADASISDDELDAAGDYAGSSLTVVREGGANTDDVFGLEDGGASFEVSGGDLTMGGSVFAGFSLAGGQLSVDFDSSQTTATPALVGEVLRAITYENTGDPAVVEFALTITFEDGDPGGSLSVSQSLPVFFDPALVPTAANTTIDFEGLSSQLSNDDPVDARVIQEVLFYGFQFEDADESAFTDINTLLFDATTSDPNTTGTRFETDAPLRLQSLDLDNFSSMGQEITIHGYRDGVLLDSLTFSLSAESGPQMLQPGSASASFATVDEVRFTTSENESVAMSNVVVDSANQPPVLDLDTDSGGSDVAVAFSENANQGIGPGDGLPVTAAVALSDSDGTVDSATLTLTNPQGDTGEALVVDAAELAPEIDVTSDTDQLVLQRNGATEGELGAAIEAVRYQNDSDAPDTSDRVVSVAVTDDGGGSVSAESTIAITADNDSPAVIVPGGTLMPTEDVTFDFSGAESIQVADPDAAGASIEVSLTVANGTLTLGSTSGIVFVAGANGVSDMTVSGTVADINAALGTLSYLGDSDFDGVDLVEVVVDDLGNTGAGGALTDSVNVSLDVQPVNDAPIVSGIGDQVTDEDEPIASVPFSVGDAESAADDLMVTVSSDDPGLFETLAVSGDGSERAVEIVPAANENGSATVTVSVSDGALSTDEVFNVQVTPVNDAPVFVPDAFADRTTAMGSELDPPVSFRVEDVETDDALLAVSANSDDQTLVPDAGLALSRTDPDGNEWTLDIEPAADETGSARITVVVDDGEDTTARAFELTVNAPPLLEAPGAEVLFDEADGLPVVVDADASVSDTELDAAGDYAGAVLVVERTDQPNEDDQFGFDTDAGAFESGAGELTADGDAFAAVTLDPGTLSIQFTSAETPATPALVNTVLRAITYANTGDPVETLDTLEVRFADELGSVASADVDLIIDPELAPVTDARSLGFESTPLASGAAVDGRVVDELLLFGFEIALAGDPDADSNELRAVGAADDPAADGARFESDAVFALASIDLRNLAASQQDVTLLGYRDGSLLDSLTFSLSPGEGYRSETPGADSVAFTAVDEVRLTAADGVNVAVDNILVEAANTPPTLTGTPDTAVAQDGQYAFLPAADDPDPGDTLSFSIDNQPGWAGFDVATGELSGSPGNADVGVYPGIEISVSDAAGASDSVGPFAIEVSDVNDSPVITGTPPGTATEDVAYGFTPIASDPDAGDTLAFSVTGRPPWADFDPTTGTLSGTPGQVDVGSYGGISITVTDSGGLQDTLGPFEIEVLEVDDPPVIDAPPDLTAAQGRAVDATALYTAVELTAAGMPSGQDEEDGELAPEPVARDNPALLPPGSHEIQWQVTDSAGQTATAIQRVEVRPLVGIGGDRTVQEGTTVRLPVTLNGAAIDGGNVEVDFDIDPASSAGGGDHDLSAPGSLVFLGDARRGNLGFDVLAGDASDEGPETLVIEFVDARDGVLGSRRALTVTIIEGNVPPAVTLTAAQAGRADPAVVVDGSAGSGAVTITADTTDATPVADMSFDWDSGDSGIVDADGDPGDRSFTFDPTAVASGVYEFTASATDEGSPSQTGGASILLRVADPLPTLGGEDRDGDGIDDASEGFADSDGDGVPAYRDPYDSAGSTLHEAVGDDAGYRIETEPGLGLTLGRVAFEADTGQALVTADQIEAVLGRRDGLGNVGGYFDFIVSDLPMPGASVDVVIPQRAPVPARAVYRKIGAAGEWVDFVEDAGNALASAPGAAGFCPPPDDGAYTPGLSAGDWCVRLTLEDGGPNDADGEANARIADPGGVAQDNADPAIGITGDSLSAESDGTLRSADGDPVEVTGTAGGTFELALSVESGTLTLGSANGLTFTGGANGESAFTVRGTLDEINAALATLLFDPAGAEVGAVLLELLVTDLATGRSDAASAGIAAGAPVSIPAMGLWMLLLLAASFLITGRRGLRREARGSGHK